MTEPPLGTDADDPHYGDPHPGLPGWVKTVLTVAAVLVLLLLVLAFVIGGEHGPGRHTSEAQPHELPAQMAARPS